MWTGCFIGRRAATQSMLSLSRFTEPKAAEEWQPSGPTYKNESAEETSGANPVNNSEATPSAPAQQNLIQYSKQDKTPEKDAIGEAGKRNDSEEKADLPTDAPRVRESDRVDEKLAIKK